MALDFDGVNDFCTHGDINAIDGTALLTVSYHVLTDVLPGVADVHVSKTDGTTFGFDSASTAAGAWGVNFSAADNGTVAGITAADGVWRHLAFSYNGGGATNADKLKMYLNGTALSPTYGGTIPTTIGATTFGLITGMRSGGTFPANVKIANLKIWTAALGEGEIKIETYSYTPVRTRDLILWAPYDDGTTAADYSGSGNNGTVTEAVQSGTKPPVTNYGTRVLGSRNGRRHDDLRRGGTHRNGPLVPLFSQSWIGQTP